MSADIFLSEDGKIRIVPKQLDDRAVLHVQSCGGGSTWYHVADCVTITEVANHVDLAALHRHPSENCPTCALASGNH